MKRDAGRGQPDLTVQSSKENNPVLMEKREYSNLFACQLAISQRSIGYHTSFERGDAELSAYVKSGQLAN